MISFLKGTIDHITDAAVELNVGGIGFEVQISPETASRLGRSGPEAAVYTYTYLREDQIALYGFASRDELALFRQLITVSGIGPRAGLSLLSVMGADELRFAIISGDVRAISRAPGIGKRSAERLILELKGKLHVDDDNLLPQGEQPAGADTGMEGAAAEAVEALAALGYARSDAAAAVRKAVKDGAAETGEILKSSLRFIS